MPTTTINSFLLHMGERTLSNNPRKQRKSVRDAYDITNPEHDEDVS